MSRSFAVSRATVRRCRTLSAASYIVLQAMVLNSITDPPVCIGTPRTSAAVMVAWDETQETLCLGLDGRLQLNQQISTWQIMVIMATLYVALTPSPRSAAEDVVADSMQFVRCPVPLSNTSSSAMYHGLTKVPLGRQFENQINKLNATIDLLMRTWCRDNIGTNLKLTVFLRSIMGNRTVGADKTCDLHSLKLVEVALTWLVGQVLLGRLFSMALMFRSSTQYFLRLIYSVGVFLDAHLDFRAGPAPSQGLMYARQVLSLVESTYGSHAQRSEKNGDWKDDDVKRQTKSFKKFMAQWIRLLEILNGLLFLDCKLHGLPHYCIDPLNEDSFCSKKQKENKGNLRYLF